jgi:hypothetical protein
MQKPDTRLLDKGGVCEQGRRLPTAAQDAILPHNAQPSLCFAGPGCWRRTESSRNRRGLLKGTQGEGKDAMHLLSTDRREPFQELVSGRSLVEVLEQRGNRQACAPKAPCPAKLPGVAVDSAAPAPVHTASLSLKRLEEG